MSREGHPGVIDPEVHRGEVIEVSPKGRAWTWVFPSVEDWEHSRACRIREASNRFSRIVYPTALEALQHYQEEMASNIFLGMGPDRFTPRDRVRLIILAESLKQRYAVRSESSDAIDPATGLADTPCGEAKRRDDIIMHPLGRRHPDVAGRR